MYKEHAQQFLEDKITPTAHDKFYGLGTSYGYGPMFATTGGIWNPDEGVDKKPRMFMVSVMDLIGKHRSSNPYQNAPAVQLFSPRERAMLDNSVIWGLIIKVGTDLSEIQKLVSAE